MSLPSDPVADALVAFLRDAGAGQTRHAGGRSLLDHLLGTAAILRRWGQPPALVHAALIHSVHGTEAFGHRLIPDSRRGELAAIAGADAARLADRFATTPRSLLFAGTLAWAGGAGAVTADEHDALLILHMANLADQAAARDGSPGPWLTRVRGLAGRLIDPAAPALPPFVEALATVTEADEREGARLYRTALAEPGDLVAQERRLAAAASALPVGEPCVWLATLAAQRGDEAAARWWGDRAQRRLAGLGAAWDKRRPFDEWLSAASGLAAGLDAPAAVTPASADAGRRRFDRYVEAIGESSRGLYPELVSRPWLDAAAFPVVADLEAHADAICAELEALSPQRFQPESERIDRLGTWDVAFFYERGRRRDEVCDACPVTTAAIERHGTMRTASGLIYVSRMAPGTHIHPHRGPTNLRVRCHLGIVVPDGDCAIRVGDETRRWERGRCLVFDDHFEHEAYNHTGQERIVLIVDLWHPGLSAAEVTLLEGMQRYASGYAQRLSRYWSVNDAAVRSGPVDDDPL